MRNFKSYLVGVILEEQIKVTCKDKHSHMCSKGQESEEWAWALKKRKIVDGVENLHILQNAALEPVPNSSAKKLFICSKA